MNNNEIKALVSLLDDEDKEILSHVEQKIISLGDAIIPFLEEEWENNFDPNVQKKIEDLIHLLQFDSLKNKLHQWKESNAAGFIGRNVAGSLPINILTCHWTNYGKTWSRFIMRHGWNSKPIFIPLTRSRY